MSFHRRQYNTVLALARFVMNVMTNHQFLYMSTMTTNMVACMINAYILVSFYGMHTMTYIVLILFLWYSTHIHTIMLQGHATISSLKYGFIENTYTVKVQ